MRGGWYGLRSLGIARSGAGLDLPHLLEFGFGGLPWHTKEVFERWSPVEFAENVTTPLLITHGEEDARVPIPQGEQYFRTSKKLGKEVELHMG